MTFETAAKPKQDCNHLLLKYNALTLQNSVSLTSHALGHECT